MKWEKREESKELSHHCTRPLPIHFFSRGSSLTCGNLRILDPQRVSRLFSEEGAVGEAKKKRVRSLHFLILLLLFLSYLGARLVVLLHVKATGIAEHLAVIRPTPKGRLICPAVIARVLG